MPRTITLLILASMLAAPAPQLADEVAAAVLLLDNQSLCVRLGRARTVAATDSALVAAKALASETLEIAGEHLERSSRRGKRAALARQVHDLQRRLCMGIGSESAEASGNGEAALRAVQLEQLGSRLEAEIGIDDRRRRVILDRFLDRRDEAISAALAAHPVGESAAARQAREREAESAARDGAGADVDSDWQALAAEGESARQRKGRNSGAVEKHEAPPLPQTPTGTVASAGTGPVELWNPSPGELGSRRAAQVAEFRRRLDGWRRDYTRELDELASARRTLASELRARSLEQLGSICSELTEVVDRVDYSFVLSAPDPSLRSHLVGMLGAYAEAGRRCEAGRYAFAWIEIEKADQRWKALTAELSALAGG